MALDILKRLGNYLFPLGFLAVAVYSTPLFSSVVLCHENRKRSLLNKQTNKQTGVLLILLELVTFQTRPADVLGPRKLNERIFGKLWLRLGLLSLLCSALL